MTKIRNFFSPLKYLRLKPFSTDSQEGRDAERYRRSILTSGVNILSKLSSMIVMVLSVSWTLPYLGEERFGVWMAVASMAALLSFLDLGIGNALTNRVAYLASKNNKKTLRSGITGGLGILFLVSLLSGVLLFLVAQAVDWGRVFKLSEPELGVEAKRTVLVFTFLFVALSFSNGIGRVFHGLQRGFLVHFANISGSLLSLIALAIAVNLEASTPFLIACVMGGLVLGNLGLSIILLNENLFGFGGIKNSMFSESSFILRTGGLFFVLQIGTMVAWGADSVIIASTSGAAAVAAYSLVQRLGQFISQPVQIFNAPLWAAYADAVSTGEGLFVRRTFVKSLKYSFGFSAFGALLLVVFGEELIYIWTDGEITVPAMLLGLMACWLILESTGSALGVFLNGIGVVKQQVVVVSAFILLGLPLKIMLAYEMGSEGVVLAGIGSYLLTTVVGYVFIFRKQIMERVH